MTFLALLSIYTASIFNGVHTVKEHPYVWDRALVNGLAPDERMRRNGLYMESMVNMEPTEFGAVVPEPIVQPITATANGPFPQLLRGERVDYLLGPTSVSTANVSAGTTTLLQASDSETGADASITTGGTWQHASFYDVDFFTNGVNLVWNGPPSSDGECQVGTGLTCVALTAHNNRLLLGGLSGAWFSGERWDSIFQTWRELQPVDSFAHEDMTFDTGWVVWGERGGGDSAIPFYMFLTMLGVYGNDIFDQFDVQILESIERGEIGMCPLRKPGTVQAMRPLGNDIVVYGENSVSRLSPNGATYVENEEATTGIEGRAALNGDNTEHVWIDTTGLVHFWPAGSRDRVLGYSAQMTTGVVGTLVSSNFTSGYAPWESEVLGDLSPDSGGDDVFGGFLALSAGRLNIYSGGTGGYPSAMVDFGGAADLTDGQITFDLINVATDYMAVRLYGNGVTVLVGQYAVSDGPTITIDVLDDAIAFDVDAGTSLTEQQIRDAVAAAEYVAFTDLDPTSTSGNPLTIDNITITGVPPQSHAILFDPLLHEYRIVTPTSCYSLTRPSINDPRAPDAALGGPHSVIPRSMFRDATSGLVGVATGTQTTMNMTTFPVDTTSRGKKHCSVVLMASEGVTAAKCRILWRNENGEVFRNGPLVPFSPLMAAFPRTSFVDGKVYVQGTVSADAVVSRIEARIQHEDLRLYRGTRAVAQGVAADE